MLAPLLPTGTLLHTTLLPSGVNIFHSHVQNELHVLQRAVFREQMKAVKDRRKTVKLSMQLEPGRQPPIAQDVEKYRAVQAQHEENMRDREAAAAAERRVTKMRSSGACSFVSVSTDASAPSRESAVPGKDAATRLESPMQASEAALQGPSESVLQLLRCKNASNDLAKRACSLKRFVTAAGTIILRCWQHKKL